MKFLSLLLPAVVALSGCGSMGSYEKSLASNERKDEQHKKLQVYRLAALQTCYSAAKYESQIHGCQLLHMQLNVDQGILTTANQHVNPATPEEQVLDGLKTAVGALVGLELGKSIVNGIKTPTQIVDREVPVIVDREVPLIINSPSAEILGR